MFFQWKPSLAFVFGSYGKDKLIAQQAPLQLTYMITTSILAMIQAQATIVRKQLSEAECLLDRNDVINGEIKYDQAILSANAGLGTGITVSSMIAVLIIIANKALSELFMDTKQMQNNDISTSCNTLFTICSISIVLDGIRNFSTGALRGLGELSKPPMISAVAIFSCICLGIVLGRLDLLQPASLYIMRAVGIVISAGLIMKQWNMKSRIHLQDIMKKFRLNDDRSNLLTSYSTFSNVVADKRIKETDIERGLLNNGTELYPKPV